MSSTNDARDSGVVYAALQRGKNPTLGPRVMQSPMRTSTQYDHSTQKVRDDSDEHSKKFLYVGRPTVQNMTPHQSMRQLQHWITGSGN